MKKIINILAIAALAFSFASCEKFLDTTNYWSKDSSNFPQNEADADQMITGIYNNLNASLPNSCNQNHFIWDNICSDDCLGAGGSDDADAQAEDFLLHFGADMYNDFYCDRYKGIARANSVIESLESCGVTGDKLKQYYGEAFFLRAWFYYEIASMFGNIPCPTSSTANPLEPQISGEALWGRIIEDCKIAADIMPAVQSKGDGHVDKYAAEALLGRAYLFASGFYGLSDITLPAFEHETLGIKIAEGTKISKSDVGAYITDCVNKSGYSLVRDPHELWSYTNRCSMTEESPWYGKDYQWCQNDGAVNPEALFSIKFNTQAGWGTTMGYSNFTALFMGIRGQEDNETHFPFGVGWGMASVAPNLVIDWTLSEPNDLRRDASIISVDKFDEYVFNGENNVQETGYYQIKNIPVTAYDEEGELRSSFINVMFPGLAYAEDDPEDKDYNMLADMPLIRFAEVLLMDAEINGNADSFNRVRKRAGLAEIDSPSQEDIRNERRWELCFEGIRFNDIRRYGEDYAAAALDKQQGVACHNCSEVETTNDAAKFNGGYGVRYKATKGFVKIPESQISLSSGNGPEHTFVQNEGWGAGTDYAGWN